MMHLRQAASFVFTGAGGGHPDDIKPADFLEGMAPWVPPAAASKAWFATDAPVINKQLMHLSWDRVTGAVTWSLGAAVNLERPQVGGDVVEQVQDVAGREPVEQHGL
jgi:hypothetical protein